MKSKTLINAMSLLALMAFSSYCFGQQAKSQVLHVEVNYLGAKLDYSDGKSDQVKFENNKNRVEKAQLIAKLVDEGWELKFNTSRTPAEEEWIFFKKKNRL